MSAGEKRSSPERLAKAVPKNVQTSEAVSKGRDTASEVFLFISLFCFQPQATRSQITELRFRSVISVSFFQANFQMHQRRAFSDIPARSAGEQYTIKLGFLLFDLPQNGSKFLNIVIEFFVGDRKSARFSVIDRKLQFA